MAHSGIKGAHPRHVVDNVERGDGDNFSEAKEGHMQLGTHLEGDLESYWCTDYTP